MTPKIKRYLIKRGKDSYKFSATGAHVAVVSPNKTTLLKQSTSTIDKMVALFGDFDYLLVEGLKTLLLPRIAIFREQLNENYFEVSDAITTDSSIAKEDIPKSCEHLDLNNFQQIRECIDLHGKKILF